MCKLYCVECPFPGGGNFSDSCRIAAVLRSVWGNKQWSRARRRASY